MIEMLGNRLKHTHSHIVIPDLIKFEESNN